MNVLKAIGALASIFSVIWLVYQPGFSPLISLLTSLFAFGATFMSKSKNGKGGKAIVAGDESEVSIDNSGTIESGSGGTGGKGGDAIHVAKGVKLNIRNNGAIKGGDAGK